MACHCARSLPRIFRRNTTRPDQRAITVDFSGYLVAPPRCRIRRCGFPVRQRGGSGCRAWFVGSAISRPLYQSADLTLGAACLHGRTLSALACFLYALIALYVIAGDGDQPTAADPPRPRRRSRARHAAPAASAAPTAQRQQDEQAQQHINNNCSRRTPATRNQSPLDAARTRAAFDVATDAGSDISWSVSPSPLAQAACTGHDRTG